MSELTSIEPSRIATDDDALQKVLNKSNKNLSNGESSVLPSLPCPDSLFNQCNTLLKDTINFNLHANILKKLLNLKERSSGYDLYARRPSNPSASDETNDRGESVINNNGESSSSQSVFSSNELESLTETIKKLREEVTESHRLGFCLAYNIQCLHKRLTGSPVDVNSSANLIKQLREKYDSFKTRESILKYEFQEKRKLLRRLRNQLEETREDWKLLKVTKRSPEEEQDDLLWSETLRRKFASKRKQPSEESGFMESKDGREGCESTDTGASNSEADGDIATGSEVTDENAARSDTTGYEDLAIALDNRRLKLDHLEEECYNLFSSLSARSSDLSRSKVDEYHNHLNHRSTLPLVPALLFPDDVNEGLLDEVVDVDDVDDEDEDDDLSDPLSDEFDELNLPIVDTLDPLEPVDNTEEADMSDLPWDSNNLYESRTTSLLTDTNRNSQSTDAAPASDLPSTVSTSSTFSPNMMVNIGVGMDDDEEDNEDEYTQQEMESIAETGEPLVLCRLRRRAVEILVSRLRDEKVLHESRESELKDQLEELKELNNKLINEMDSLKSSSLTGWGIKMVLTSMMTTALFASSLLVYFAR